MSAEPVYRRPGELEASPSRRRAAQALRRLGHAIVGHDVDDAFFDRVVDAVERVLPDVEAAPERARPVLAMKRRMFDQRPDDGAHMEHFPDCVVSGEANPMGIAIDVRRQGEEAVARVRLGAAFEGAPGRAHGGVVAAIFDDVLGYVLTIIGEPAFTGRLCVSYLAPTPLGVELEFRGRLRQREGRKLYMVGEARHGDRVIAEAEGVFISIPPERLGPGPGG